MEYYFNIVSDVLIDTSLDCIKMLPFLFAAFLVLEVLEHYSGSFLNRMLAKVGRTGPIFGALAGCVPQCGFSVMAANLFAGGAISPGTLISVFIATSDEAILILLGNPGRGKDILFLLAVKVVIAILAGYAFDHLWHQRQAGPRHLEDLCYDCGCHDHEGIIMPAVKHTIKILIYLFIFSGVLNLLTEIFGIERLSAFLLGNTIFQPLIAAVIGLIPNCAASVILTQLYLDGAITFASVIAGLCTGAGVGLIVLFKMNPDKKENLKILGILYLTASAAGILLSLAGW